jgi:hypothetical protein
MISHYDLPLFARERPRLPQDDIGNPDLAHIVQRSRAPQQEHLFVGQAEGAAQHRGHLADALGVAASLVIPEFGGAGEPLQGVEIGALELHRPLPDPLFEHLILLHDLAMEVPGLEQVADPEEHLSHLERLGQEVLRPRRESPTAGLGGRVAREHQDRHECVRSCRRAKLLQDGEAVELAHVQIEQDDVRVLVRVEAERSSGIGRRDDLRITCGPENPGEGVDVDLLVVDDQDPGVCEWALRHPISPDQGFPDLVDQALDAEWCLGPDFRNGRPTCRARDPSGRLRRNCGLGGTIAASA